MNKKVLVVMPCYNHQDLIEESMISVVNQTYDNFDLVCCDDKSTDSTLEVLKNLKEKYNFILMTNDVNLGTGLTVNKCIDELNMNGDYDYICWVSSDNILKNNFIEKHVDKLNEGFAISYSGWGYIDKTWEFLPSKDFFHMKNDFRLGPSFMYTKKLFKVAGPYHEGGGEDYYFAVKAALKFAKFGYINDILVKYRAHENSVGGRGPLPNRLWCSAEAKELAKGIIVSNGNLSYQ
jgi:glycosyltransferase involved in cell wall biosynthesis